MTTETIAPIPVAQTPRKTGLVRRILRNPVGLVAVLVLALMGFAAVFGGWLAPFDANQADAYLILAEPGDGSLLGRDNAGRTSGRACSSPPRSPSGRARRLDRRGDHRRRRRPLRGLLQGVARRRLQLDHVAHDGPARHHRPAGRRAVVGPSVWWAMVIFGALMSPAFYRLVYASVSSVREELYVDAAASRASPTRASSPGTSSAWCARRPHHPGRDGARHRHRHPVRSGVPRDR